MLSLSFIETNTSAITQLIDFKLISFKFCTIEIFELVFQSISLLIDEGEQIIKLSSSNKLTASTKLKQTLFISPIQRILQFNEPKYSFIVNKSLKV